MRISFTGASGTGKSTLAQWVRDTYQLEFNPVGSRSVAKDMGYDNPYDVDAAGKRQEFQDRLLRSKLEWELEHPAFVTDRTPLDNLVYTVMHAPYGPSEDYTSRALGGVARYDVVFYCPLGAFINIDGDPHRVSDMAYHKRYDEILRSYLGNHFPEGSTCMVTLHDRDLEARKATVAGVLATLWEN